MTKPSKYVFVSIITVFALIGAIGNLSFAKNSALQSSPNPPSVNVFSLADCYRFALKQSEAVAIKQELIKEEEGRFLLAFSTAMPKASYVWTDKREKGNFHTDFVEGKFVFSQPIFTGFKEFAAISGSRAEGRQRKQEMTRAKQLLFTDVSDAFYFYLSY